MKFNIQAGAQFDTATPDEVRGILSDGQQSWFQEMARGLKHFDFALSGTVSGGTLTIDDPSQEMPNAGFVWAVQSLAVDGLATNDTLKVYISPAGPGGRFRGQLTAAAPMWGPGSKGLVLKGGQRLAVTGTGLATTAGALTIWCSAIEVPEFLIWKIL